ncbi:MAG: methionyl-tRNA formyltransferase [Bacteroidota bacterium]
MRIVFMGTPEFSIPTLDILVQAGYEISAVVTAPDKPAGRGNKLRPSPIKTFALSKGLPVLQPVKLRDPAFIEELEAIAPDLMVVVAFRMLPEMVWSIPKIGTFNLHASLLPDYRGAAPINWVLINGEKQTGLTTFFIDKQIDTGSLLLRTAVDIPYEWTAGDLHDRMMVQGAELVLKTVKGLEAGSLTAQPQDESLYQHPAPKIFKEDCRINWDQPQDSVYHFIRGLSPYPTAFTMLEDKIFKVFKAREATGDAAQPGTLKVENDQLFVACQEGWLELLEIQLQGKKRISAGDFVRGYRGSLEKVE